MDHKTSCGAVTVIGLNSVIKGQFSISSTSCFDLQCRCMVLVTSSIIEKLLDSLL